MVCGVVLRLCLISTVLAGLSWGTAAPLRAVRSESPPRHTPPHPESLLPHTPPHPESLPGFDDMLALALAALGWVAVAWITLVAVAEALSRWPLCRHRIVGRSARRAARRIAPAAVRRGVIAAMGLSVSVLAAAPTSSAMSSIAPVPSAASMQSDDPATASDSLPVIGRPVAADKPPSASEPRPAARTTVAVQPGDSLWKIADRALGSDATPKAVADSWPRWFAANRDEIGPDPHRIRPGMRLVAPSVSTTD